MAEWTEEQTRTFCRIALDVHRSNPTNDQGFKKQQWNQILTEFNRRTNASFSKDRLQNKYSGLKKDYQTFKALKECSGFGWDDVAKIPTASTNTWTAYLAKHKEAAKFRFKTFPFYEEMHELLEGNVATGEFSFGTFDTPVSTAQNGVNEESAQLTASDLSGGNGLDISPEYEDDQESDNASSRTSRVANSTTSAPRKRKKTSSIGDISDAFQDFVKDKRSKVNAATETFNRKYAGRYNFEEKIKILTLLYSDINAHIFECFGEEDQIQMMERALSND